MQLFRFPITKSVHAHNTIHKHLKYEFIFLLAMKLRVLFLLSSFHIKFPNLTDQISRLASLLTLESALNRMLNFNFTLNTLYKVQFVVYFDQSIRINTLIELAFDRLNAARTKSLTTDRLFICFDFSETKSHRKCIHSHFFSILYINTLFDRLLLARPFGQSFGIVFFCS